jgi:DNA-binding transcriptional MocR family regulator
MSQQIFIGSEISFQSLRDYIIEHRIDRGDTLVMNPFNYDHILDEIKAAHAESIEIPVNVFGVRLVKDTTGTIEGGKIQIVKNERF